jgi:hypothetical protein
MQKEDNFIDTTFDPCQFSLEVPLSCRNWFFRDLKDEDTLNLKKNTLGAK